MKLLKNKRGEVVIRAGFVADCRVSALVYLVLITTLRPPQCKHSESNIVDESWLVRMRLSLCSTEARKHLALLKGLNFWVSWVESYQCLLPTLLGMVKALLEWADELLSKIGETVRTTWAVLTKWNLNVGQERNVELLPCLFMQPLQ